MTARSPQIPLNIKEIAGCARDLNTLAPDTEKEFLNIGKTLETLADICFGMTDKAVKLSGTANFRTVDEDSGNDSFVRENEKIFDAVASHVKETLTSLSGGEHLLVELLSQLKKLRGPIQKLKSLGKTFRVLGIGIKIESSRNHETVEGFNLLAGEVAEIASLVETNCQYCTDKADLVEKDISNSRQVFRNSDKSYDDSGERAIQKTLQSLEEIGSRSDRLAAGIQERSSAMVQGISDVVMAMQFHDITRQQLENVASALTEAIEKAKNIPAPDTSAENEEVVLEIYSILSIQAAHLNSIYEQIMHAKKSIELGLGNTRDQATIQAQDAKMLLEIDGSGGNSSVVTDLIAEIDNIELSLNNSLAIVKLAADVSRQVHENVSQIGVFVNKIEEIASDVKILAINAMVEAIKTETVGNTLIVLAKELSSLSQEARDGATDSIKILDGIVVGTEKQLDFSINLDQRSGAADELISSAKECIGTILSSLQEIGSIGKTMDDSSRDLADRISKIVPGIRFPKIMGERIDKNWEIICGAIQRIENSYPQFLEENHKIKEKLEQLANQYVMDRERSIHAQVTGGAIVDAGAGEAEFFGNDGFELFEQDTPETRNTERSFGDNVELF